MREILFRGKRVDDGKWVYGHYVYQYGANIIYLPDGVDEYGGFDYYHINPETVGQYTGLCDKNGKNGKMIFEGDIVNFSNILYYIVFADGCFRICRNGQYSYTLHNLHSAFEVIGNIHDNPELLKGE